MFFSNKINYLGLVCLVILTVLIILVQTKNAQAYFLTLSQNRNFYPYPYPYQSNSQSNRLPTRSFISSDDREDSDELQERTGSNQTNYRDLERDENATRNENPKGFAVTIRDPAEFFQTGMDVITIVWYIATIIALAVFFLLVICSDKCCCTSRNRNSNNSNNNNNNNLNVKPSSPTPSYSEFAPPSYDTVMKMGNPSKNTGIFVINSNRHNKDDEMQRQYNNSNSNNNSGSQLNTTAIVKLYTHNELPKMDNSKITRDYNS